MPLAAGTRLGPYEIAAPLGAGGMGEVYRARDTKLGREVAVKVLPADMAGDPERLARFRREAHLLATLNHPHVAAIYGLEEIDGQPFLILELVEGETLAERLARGPIPADEALEIARQIALGVQEAHGKGVVHRDLKPANVQLTRDEKVKVLDFGLAKDYSDDGSGSSADLSHSPTVTRAGTEAGVVLGTAAYMSPEQARGKRVDKRTDIWAFGCVLFEMLTGGQAFRGETVSDTLAAILKQEPEWTRLPLATSPAIRSLLGRCLQKDRDRRLHDIADARLEIEEARSAGAHGVVDGGGRPASTRWRRVPWGLAAALVAALAGWALAVRRAPAVSTALATTGITRTTIEPELHWGAPHVAFETDFIDTPGRSYDVSPDGRRLLVVKHVEGVTTNKLHVVSNWREGLKRQATGKSGQP